MWDFHGSSVAGHPLCSAGDAGSIHGQGTKISHDVGQLACIPQLREPTCNNCDSTKVNK